jgi:uncharacterized protein (TIGR02266 family)
MSDVNRRAGRSDLEVDVEIKAAEEQYAVTTKNIGLGGIFLATQRLRAIGERVALKFTLPGVDDPIAVESEVRWVRPPPGGSSEKPAGMGMRFVNLTFEASVTIQRFLADRERASERRSRSS